MDTVEETVSIEGLPMDMEMVLDELRRIDLTREEETREGGVTKKETKETSIRCDSRSGILIRVPLLLSNSDIKVDSSVSRLQSTYRGTSKDQNFMGRNLEKGSSLKVHMLGGPCLLSTKRRNLRARLSLKKVETITIDKEVTLRLSVRWIRLFIKRYRKGMKTKVERTWNDRSLTMRDRWRNENGCTIQCFDDPLNLLRLLL